MARPSVNPWKQRPGVLFGVCTLFVCAAVLLAVWPRRHVSDMANQNVNSNSNTNSALLRAASAAASIDDLVPDTALPDLSGTPVSIAAESDRVLTVVALWNTKCADCITEVVALNPLVKKYANRVSFIALNRGDASSVAQVEATDKAIESRVLVDGTGGQAVLTGDAGMPTMYFIRDHAVVGVGFGPLTTDQIERKITQIFEVE